MKIGLTVFFRKYDADRDGKLNKEEFKNLMHEMDPDMTEKEIDEAFF